MIIYDPYKYSGDEE